MAPKEFQNVKTGSKHGHQNQDLFDEFLGSFWDQFYLGPVFFFQSCSNCFEVHFRVGRSAGFEDII